MPALRGGWGPAAVGAALRRARLRRAEGARGECRRLGREVPGHVPDAGWFARPLFLLERLLRVAVPPPPPPPDRSDRRCCPNRSMTGPTRPATAATPRPEHRRRPSPRGRHEVRRARRGRRAACRARCQNARQRHLAMLTAAAAAAARVRAQAQARRCSGRNAARG